LQAKRTDDPGQFVPVIRPGKPASHRTMSHSRSAAPSRAARCLTWRS